MEKPENQVVENVDKLLPILVEYCPVCSLCFEYCQFSGLHVEEKKVEQKSDPNEALKNDDSLKKEDVQIIPEKPIKKAAKTKVQTIKVLLYEKKNRTLTQISGFDAFQISGKDVSKKLTKKFGCGSGSVTTDGFELQGAFNEPLVEFLLEEFEGLLTEKNIEVEEKLDKKHKKKAKPGSDE